MSRRKGNFQKINSIMGDVSKKLNVQKGLNEMTLINKWPDLVGPRFCNSSRVFAVKRNNNAHILIIAAKSSSLVQELFFFKRDLLRKINPVAIELGFKVEDIVFDAKLWKEEKQASKGEENISIKFIEKSPTDRELSLIKVPEKELSKIKESFDRQNFASEEKKQDFFNVVIKDIKTQIWRKKNNFPLCKHCGIALDYFYTDRELYCPACQSNA